MNHHYNQLSLDQSTTNTGWCIFKEGKYHSSGSYSPVGNNSDDKIVDLFLFIENIIKKHDIRLFSLEDIYLSVFSQEKKVKGENVNTHKVLGELLGTMKTLILLNKPTRLLIIPAVTWKASYGFLKRGYKSEQQKELAVITAKRLIGREATEDESEAILMAYYANKEFYNVKETILNPEKEFKITGYPHIFRYFTKQDFNDLGDKHNIKVTRTYKKEIGIGLSGKKKWETVTEKFNPSELKSLSKVQKLEFLEELKNKVGFKMELSRLMWEEQLKFLTKGED